MKKKQIIIILIFIINIFCYAENINSSTPKSRQEIAAKDSLRNIIKTSDNDTIKINALISLGRIYQNSNIDSSSFYLKKALKQSKKYKIVQLEAESYSQIGILAYYTAQYTNAINNMKDAVELFKTINDSNKVSDLLNNIGLVYTSINKNEYAIDYLQQSIEIKKALKDEYNTALAYLNIGVIYLNMNNDSIAMQYILKAMPIFKKGLHTNDSLNSMSGIAYCYNNIGQIHQKRNDNSKALMYYKKSLKYLQIIDDAVNLNLSYLNIASVGLDIAKNKKANAKIEYLKTIKNYIDKAIYGSKKLQDYNNLFLAYKNLSLYYFELNKFEKAYIYNNKYINLKDSILNKQKLNEIESSEEHYQNLLKQAEIDKKEIELNKNSLIIHKQKQLINIGTIALIIIAFLIILIIIYLRKNKKKSKALIQKNKEIEYINNNINDSLKISRFIQDAVLGGFVNKDMFFADFFALNKPKELVGGDFIWKKTIDNTIYVAVADCVGHGIPGAMVSMISNNFLHYSIKKENINLSLGALLSELRSAGIKNVLQRKQILSIIGLDLALIKYNKTTIEIEFAGANLPIYIVSEHKLKIDIDRTRLYNINNNDKTLFEIKPDRMPLGNYEILDDFSSVKFKLNKGDRIFMFSDGFADQFGGKNNKKYKYRYFKDLILSTSDNNLPEQKELIETAFNNWIGKNEQVDDVTILALEI